MEAVSIMNLNDDAMKYKSWYYKNPSLATRQIEKHLRKYLYGILESIGLQIFYFTY
jgi:hypothetical protein